MFYVITVYTECDGTVCTVAVVEGWKHISNAITDVTNASGTTLVAGYDYDVYYDIEEVAKYAPPTLSVDAAEALAVYFDRGDLNLALALNWRDSPKLQRGSGSGCV